MKKLLASAVLTAALVQARAYGADLDNLLSTLNFSYNGFGTAP